MSNLMIKYKCVIALGYPFKMAIREPGGPSPEVIIFSWSIQLSTKFHLLIKTKIPTNEELSYFCHSSCL